MPKTKHANAQTNGSALEWNVMVYMSSDNDLGSECVWALTEMQNSNLSDRIAVLAQFDPPTRGIGTKRYDFTGGIPAQRQRVEALAKKVATASKSAQGKKSINSHQVNLLANVALEEEFDSHLEDFEVENLADAVEERPALSELAPRTSNHSEDNFADPKVLAEFVEKGIERYPAKHYLVILSGYGSSPTEGLLTESNPVGSMKLDDLKKALEKVQQNHLRFLKEDPKGEIDILGLDACLMGMAEVVSQLTGTVRYLVASEGLAPATGWPYRRILEAMSKNPTAAPVDVAKIIMKSYIRYYSDYFISGISVDQSINDLSKAGQLESAVKALVETLTRPLNGRSQNGALRLNKSVVDDIVLAHWKAQTYRFDQHVDLWDFCDCLAACTSNGKVQEACETVQRAVGNCLVETDNIGAAFQHSHGLSVFFPWSFVDLGMIREYKELAFAQRTGWGNFLEAYVKETQRDPKGGIKVTRLDDIFPQDGYFGSRDNPKLDDPKDNPKLDDPKDNPKLDDPKDNPKLDDPRDNPKIEDPRDLLGGVVNGVLVFAPKVKNPPTHYYRRMREEKKIAATEPTVKTQKKKQ